MIYGIENIFLINLARRPDRLHNACERLEKIGLTDDNLKIFAAVDGKRLGISHVGNLRQGMVGCFLSHYMVIQMAIINNYDSILIFEDDVLPINNCKQLLDTAEPHLPDDWEFLWLGYSYRGVHWQKTKHQAKQVNEFWQIPAPTWGTQAFAIRGKDVMKKIHKELGVINQQIDVQLTTDILLRFGIKTYAITPCAFHQNDIKSDVQV